MANSDFLLKEIPKLHPKLDKFEYSSFWKEQITNCIEGKWANGIWMPGPLYGYSNFQTIPVENQYGSQSYDNPYLRDIDWEISYLYEEARGFSGFELDDKYTCNRLVGPERSLIEGNESTFIAFGLLEKNELEKEYIDARTYLQRVHTKNLGSPVYRNNAQHILLGGARGLGKTLLSSSFVINNFLFGGATNAEAYFQARKEKKYLTSLSILSAWEKIWVSQLQSYILDAIKFMPGAYTDEWTGEVYPAPFNIAYTGSKEIGDDVGLVHPHGSRIISRVFANNPLSSNSGRPNLVIIDEAFFAKTLQDVMNGLKGSEASKAKRNLVIFAIGTGGSVKGSSLTYAENMFYEPEKYGFLSIEDKWEGRGKIAYFIPITKTNLKYKDPNNDYKSNEEYGLKEQLAIRESLKGNTRNLEGHIINNPLYPSELFLLSDASFFPSAETKTQLVELEKGSKKDRVDQSFKGWFEFNEKGDLDFNTNTTDQPIRSYPFDGNDREKKGCIEIWKKPATDEFGSIPRNRYILGADVVDKAASTTSSLPSVFVYDRLMQEIVAEYTGRTTQPSFFYEQCRRLCEYYNGSLMYEQNLTGMFTYFEQHRALHRLADTPKSLRNMETFIEGTNTSKGINKAGTRLEENGVNYILDWINTPISENTNEIKLNTIYSPALLREMLKYHPPGSSEHKDINVDRISALVILFTYDNTLQLIRKENFNSNKVKGFLNSEYFVNRGFLKDPNFVDLSNKNKDNNGS